MHRPAIDPTSLESPVHRLPATGKVVAALMIVLAITAIPTRHAVYLVIPAAILSVCLILARLPARLLLRRLAMLEPFALGVALLAFFQPGGWRIVLILLAKCTLCFLAMILLSATTTLSQLLSVLRRFRVPSLLITTMLLMHRYLFVLLEESQRMRRARAARTMKPGRQFAWRNLSTVIGQLFIRSVDRADRVYAAMCARGWR